MESLDEYKPAVLGKGASKVHIMPIPNRMESLAVRPIVLDVAGDEIAYVDLSHRSAKKGSTLRNLFSWKK
jgi:signal recognition particle subunit SRP68